MRTNVVLVDFENVQPGSLSSLVEDFYRVVVFVGATQTKMPFEIVSAIHQMGERAEYVKIAGAGPNALDFHIAFYIGQFAAQDPAAFFHIISKDTGFDPLIKHLKSRGISVDRCASIDQLAPVKISRKKAAKERALVIGENLRQPNSTKPRTDKTLGRHIATYFGKLNLAEPEISAIITELQGDGLLRVEGGKVSYSIA